MHLTFDLTSKQQRFVESEVRRLQHPDRGPTAEQGLTAEQYLTRRLLKLLDVDLERERVARRGQNEDTIRAVLDKIERGDLPADALAPLGLVVDASGRLEPVQA